MLLEEMIQKIAKALDDRKGHKIRILEVSEVSSVCDAFIIVSGSVSSHIEAFCDSTEECMRKAGIELRNRAGRADGGWILLDYENVVVHIFTDEMRDFYDLEHTWRDANIRSFE